MIHPDGIEVILRPWLPEGPTPEMKTIRFYEMNIPGEPTDVMNWLQTKICVDDRDSNAGLVRFTLEVRLLHNFKYEDAREIRVGVAFWTKQGLSHQYNYPELNSTWRQQPQSGFFLRCYCCRIESRRSNKRERLTLPEIVVLVQHCRDSHECDSTMREHTKSYFPVVTKDGCKIDTDISTMFGFRFVPLSFNSEIDLATAAQLRQRTSKPNLEPAWLRLGFVHDSEASGSPKTTDDKEARNRADAQHGISGATEGAAGLALTNLASLDESTFCNCGNEHHPTVFSTRINSFRQKRDRADSTPVAKSRLSKCSSLEKREEVEETVKKESKKTEIVTICRKCRKPRVAKSKRGDYLRRVRATRNAQAGIHSGEVEQTRKTNGTAKLPTGKDAKTTTGTNSAAIVETNPKYQPTANVPRAGRDISETSSVQPIAKALQEIQQHEEGLNIEESDNGITGNMGGNNSSNPLEARSEADNGPSMTEKTQTLQAVHSANDTNILIPTAVKNSLTDGSQHVKHEMRMELSRPFENKGQLKIPQISIDNVENNDEDEITTTMVKALHRLRASTPNQATALSPVNNEETSLRQKLQMIEFSERQLKIEKEKYQVQQKLEELQRKRQAAALEGVKVKVMKLEHEDD